MRILNGLDGLKQLEPGAVMSIGNFDGVHLGHQRLLGRAAELKAAHGQHLAVVTFEPHPLTVLKPGQAPPRLTTKGQKRRLIEAAGVDTLVELAPSGDVLNLTAEQFWQLLRDQIRPSHLVEGRSFSFGKGRAGTVDKLQEWTIGTAVTLHVMDPRKMALLDLRVVPASSSTTRWLLSRGRVRDAAILLGRAYELEGLVVHGTARGRELGVPTANLQFDDQLIPADGVYAGRCVVDGIIWPAAVSIGTNPTFGQNPRTVEAHLIGFTGDLYDQTLRLELTDWLRDQRVFAGIEALKEWIAADIVQTLERRNLDPSRPIAKVEVVL